MSLIDWIVLIGFLSFVVIYGILKTKGKKNIKDYLLANKKTPWFMVTLSIMATQASAITFLSTPGQAYADGMRFLQFYLGLPIAMIILSITAVPIFHRLNIYTAYEYLEHRFDLKESSSRQRFVFNSARAWCWFYNSCSFTNPFCHSWLEY